MEEGNGAAAAIPVAPIQLARVPVGEAAGSRAYQSRSHAAAGVLQLGSRIATFLIKRLSKLSAVDSAIAGIGLAASFAILGVSSRCCLVGRAIRKSAC